MPAESTNLTGFKSYAGCSALVAELFEAVAALEPFLRSPSTTVTVEDVY